MTKIARLRALVLAVAATGTLSTAALVSLASATSPVDQSFFPGSLDCCDQVDSGHEMAQTFTVGVTGVLTDVSVQIIKFGSPSQPLNIQITRLNGNIPDTSQVVGSGSIAASAVTSSVTIVTSQLTVAPSINAGEHYAIVLTSSGTYGWNIGFGASGGHLVDGTGGSWTPVNGAYHGFATFVGPPLPQPASTAPRGAYCTVAGNTTDSGLPLLPGTFVNLDEGQANADGAYKGATPAEFVKDIGLTCGSVPSGYTQHGYATADMDVDAGIYPYYTN